MSSFTRRLPPRLHQVSRDKEHSGGRVNYYLAKVEHPRREDQPPYQAECEDIISALGMTFDEGCAFKAIWRSASARTFGGGKAGHDPVYDAQKVQHYGRQMEHVARHKVLSPLEKACTLGTGE
ncbi:3'-phosphatase 5'-polynucleotide kinase [Agrobacterium phage OLIVR2]|uniref:3'-phosphatase 5'-polynucleotide kinase n=1 Tax=Agrobacterium phage OLIVR1 TaxID=2723769 RepID=A0A858MRP5_9CAUD|nr:3'-phosphatase 5'-polynucleotide kinase [Agrobacterium phage OLIVR1]QIW87269.1 3'-phosphatase 5'-polynucleotide kinase [Agrobacterium phage OLIVR1]QIW87377.1 3'-phosphatase 5'-polynucleotide kinase [Agrobacterium phage OLIVR2]QIW87484.1 3'-phosphatase 5'-polynucleotide kinase [Agrobacterium phage OLIVR3]